MHPVILRTARLELSLPTDADVDAIFAACQDAAIQRYTTVPSPYERRHAEEFVGRAAELWAKGTETNWAIREAGALAGMIGVHHQDGFGGGEIGFWVAAAARGRGIVHEAARAVIDWSFSVDGLALRRIEWHAVAGNIASARAARALGFRYEGLRREGMASNAGRVDGWMAALLLTDDRIPQPWPVLADDEH